MKVTSPFDVSVTHGNLCIKGRFGWQYVQNRRGGGNGKRSNGVPGRPRDVAAAADGAGKARGSRAVTAVCRAMVAGRETGRETGRQRTPVSDVPLPPPLTPGHPLFGLGYSSTHREYPYVALHGDAATSSSAEVAEEVPIAFVYNGRPHVVMMATPSDFEDFGTGFSLSEEIVGSLSELERIEVVPYSQGVELQIQIPPARAEAVAGRDRQLAGRTGCGLCGVQTITDALRPTRTVAQRWTLETGRVVAGRVATRRAAGVEPDDEGGARRGVGGTRMGSCGSCAKMSAGTTRSTKSSGRWPARGWTRQRDSW